MTTRAQRQRKADFFRSDSTGQLRSLSLPGGVIELPALRYGHAIGIVFDPLGELPPFLDVVNPSSETLTYDWFRDGTEPARLVKIVLGPESLWVEKEKDESEPAEIAPHESTRPREQSYARQEFANLADLLPYVQVFDRPHIASLINNASEPTRTKTLHVDGRPMMLSITPGPTPGIVARFVVELASPPVTDGWLVVLLDPAEPSLATVEYEATSRNAAAAWLEEWLTNPLWLIPAVLSPAKESGA